MNDQKEMDKTATKVKSGERLKVLALNASPRGAGNTAWALGQILAGAASIGAETKLRQCCDLDLSPCSSCYGCRQGVLCGEGRLRCVVQDDMQLLYDDLEQADFFILGSPVYMGQMSAQAKIFNDRLFGRYKPRFHPAFQEEQAAKKKLLLLFTQGNPDRTLFQDYFSYTKRMFEILGFAAEDVLVIGGLRSEAAQEQIGLQDRLQEKGISLIGNDFGFAEEEQPFSSTENCER